MHAPWLLIWYEALDYEAICMSYFIVYTCAEQYHTQRANLPCYIMSSTWPCRLGRQLLYHCRQVHDSRFQGTRHGSSPTDKVMLPRELTAKEIFELRIIPPLHPPSVQFTTFLRYTGFVYVDSIRNKEGSHIIRLWKPWAIFFLLQTGGTRP